MKKLAVSRLGAALALLVAAPFVAAAQTSRSSRLKQSRKASSWNCRMPDSGSGSLASRIGWTSKWRLISELSGPLESRASYEFSL